MLRKLPASRPLRALLVLCGLWIGADSARAQATTQQTSVVAGPARLEFSAVSDEPVLSYNVFHELLIENDPVPLVRVYGDGRVHVHRPQFMKNPGDFEMYLTPNELRGLIDSMAARQVMSETTESVRSSRVAASRSRREGGELFEVLDASYSIMDIRLDTFQETASSETISGFTKTLIVENLQAHAEALPEVAALQNLLAAEREIRQLLDRPELERRR